MKINRGQLRKLIESVINESPQKDLNTIKETLKKASILEDIFNQNVEYIKDMHASVAGQGSRKSRKFLSARKFLSDQFQKEFGTELPRIINYQDKSYLEFIDDITIGTDTPDSIKEYADFIKLPAKLLIENFSLADEQLKAVDNNLVPVYHLDSLTDLGTITKQSMDRVAGTPLTGFVLKKKDMPKTIKK